MGRTDQPSSYTCPERLGKFNCSLELRIGAFAGLIVAFRGKPSKLWNQIMKSCATLRQKIASSLACFLSATALFASPFCSDTKATREYFHKFCDYVAANKTNVQAIYAAGYYMRDLVAGYKIFHERRYLDLAIAYGDGLLSKQSPRGYWQTGYRRLYLADTEILLWPFINAAILALFILARSEVIEKSTFSIMRISSAWG